MHPPLSHWTKAILQGTYQEASTVINAASQKPFTLPAYTGSAHDLAYLYQQALDRVVTGDTFDSVENILVPATTPGWRGDDLGRRKHMIPSRNAID
jgi:hypothetical protein